MLWAAEGWFASLGCCTSLLYGRLGPLRDRARRIYRAVDSFEEFGGCCSCFVDLYGEYTLAWRQTYVQAEIVTLAGIDAELLHGEISLEIAFSKGVLVEVGQGIAQFRDIRHGLIERRKGNLDRGRGSVVRSTLHQLCCRSEVVDGPTQRGRTRHGSIRAACKQAVQA